MGKGIIYLMTTAVPGLVKIGRTDDYEKRMYNLELNGYRNVTGLKREFAIEVDNYEDKEKLLHSIFEKSRLSDTELFAVNRNLVKQLLSSFDGKIVYPEEEKEVVFEEATNAYEDSLVPSDKYYFKGKTKKDKQPYDATIQVDSGNITLLKGSKVVANEYYYANGWTADREKMKINDNNILMENYICKSFSMAAVLVVGHNSNGWANWENKDKEKIDIYRHK